MILISHRGNIDGKIPEKENHPNYIDVTLGFGLQTGLINFGYIVRIWSLLFISEIVDTILITFGTKQMML